MNWNKDNIQPIYKIINQDYTNTPTQFLYPNKELILRFTNEDGVVTQYELKPIQTFDEQQNAIHWVLSVLATSIQPGNLPYDPFLESGDIINQSLQSIIIGQNSPFYLPDGRLIEQV